MGRTSLDDEGVGAVLDVVAIDLDVHFVGAGLHRSKQSDAVKRRGGQETSFL